VRGIVPRGGPEGSARLPTSAVCPVRDALAALARPGEALILAARAILLSPGRVSAQRATGLQMVAAGRGETALLHVDQKNSPAIRFYENLGFTVRAEMDFVLLEAGGGR
jgi:hypothetical protein